jgi:hypothetical protein
MVERDTSESIQHVDDPTMYHMQTGQAMCAPDMLAAADCLPQAVLLPGQLHRRKALGWSN